MNQDIKSEATVICRRYPIKGTNDKIYIGARIILAKNIQQWFFGVWALANGHALGHGAYQENVQKYPATTGRYRIHHFEPVPKGRKPWKAQEVNYVSYSNGDLTDKLDLVLCVVAKSTRCLTNPKLLVTVRSCAHRMKLVSTPEVLVPRRFALMVQEVDKVVPGGPFFIKIENWSTQPITLAKRVWWHSVPHFQTRHDAHKFFLQHYWFL